MSPLIALEVPLTEDLSALTSALWAREIPHRVVETNDRQLVLVLTEEDRNVVAQIYQFGSNAPHVDPAVIDEANAARFRRAVIRAPFTATVLALAVLVLPLSLGVFGDRVLDMLWFAAPSGSGSAVSYLWRPWTPLLLHFSLLHIACNAPLFWYFGHQLEETFGTWRVVLLSLLIGIGSNACQYLAARDAYFGGLSGLICGQFGIFLVLGSMLPRLGLAVPRAFAVSFVMMLALMSLDALTFMGVQVANIAHWSGLFLGIGVGVLLTRLPWRPT